MTPHLWDTSRGAVPGRSLPCLPFPCWDGTPAQRNAYINGVLSRVRASPGGQSVGMSASNLTPFSGSGVTQRFSFVALFLAAIGTYGVMSVAANERVREIGIRMALGAQRRDIELLMVRPGVTLAGAGVAAGIICAALLARLRNGVLFAVTPTDAGTYAVVSLLLIAVAVVACYVPARRATKHDPLIALRKE
jgi:ABC-type antimicrobial peptide transport system permease subunit